MFPDSTKERAKKILGTIRNPRLARMFADGARALAQPAVEAVRTLVQLNRMEEQLRGRVAVSNAKTLDELRGDLQNLRSGMSLQLPITDWSPDQTEQLWSASNRLGEEFGCKPEVRPDGCFWFVKPG